MKVVVFGAGSVGCLIGGAWLAAGIDVRFIGRERIRAEIEQNGLTVSDVDGWRAHFEPERIDYRVDTRALADADLIALTVKSTATESAANAIAHAVKPGATLVSFQNGITNAVLLADLLPGVTVVQGMVPYNVVRLGPGHWHKATMGELAAGQVAATERLAGAIGDGPGRLVLHDDMVPVVWGKLLLNLNNAVNALSGLGLRDQLKRRDYRRVAAAAMKETLALLDAAGIAPAKVSAVPPRLMPALVAAPDVVFALFLKLQKVDASARSSMADDLAAGRATEIDHLNGEVARLAARLGRTAPINETMVALIKEAEQSPRRWSAADLRARVLG